MCVLSGKTVLKRLLSFILMLTMLVSFGTVYVHGGAEPETGIDGGAADYSDEAEADDINNADGGDDVDGGEFADDTDGEDIGIDDVEIPLASMGEKAFERRDIVARIYAGLGSDEPLNDGTSITISGSFPEGAYADAYPVTLTNLFGEGIEKILAAFDISVYDADGERFSQRETATVSITLPNMPPFAADDELTVFYITEDGKPVNTGAKVTVTDDGFEFAADHFSIYAVVMALSADNAPVSIKISDEIRSSGKLTAVLTDTDGNAVDDANGSCVWYKSASENGSYEEVDNRQAVSENWINPAMDGGARMYYYVVYTSSDGLAQLTSDPVQVEYYDMLQNGSFEIPAVEEGIQTYSASNSHVQVSNDTQGLVWRTTGLGSGSNINRDIEIVRPSNNISHALLSFGITFASDGEQFAELNCETWGVLYQDVLTVPGSTLYWGLDHAKSVGDSEYDGMWVVIMPADEADALGLIGPEDLWRIDGGYIVERIKNDRPGEWTHFEGIYEVPEGQYLTRFFFVSSEASTGTAGNLIDNVFFTGNMDNAIESDVLDDTEGFVLPKTGGKGSALFTGVGAMTALGGAGALFASISMFGGRKRKRRYHKIKRSGSDIE